MTTDIDTRRSWYSRTAFGVSAIALSSMLHGACQERSEATPSPRTQVATATPAPKIVPAIEVKEPEKANVEKSTPKVTVAPEKKTEAAKPKTASTEAAKGTEGITLKRVVVTTHVSEREPLADATFSVGGEPVMAFVEVKNASPEDGRLMIKFEHASGKQVGFVELDVPANQPRWRTWGRTHNIKDSGEWTAIVATADGTELGRSVFQVEAAESAELAPGG